MEQLHKEMDSIKTEKQFMKSELEAQLHASQEKQANLRAWNEESAAQKDELLCTSEQLGGGGTEIEGMHMLSFKIRALCGAGGGKRA